MLLPVNYTITLTKTQLYDIVSSCYNLTKLFTLANPATVREMLGSIFVTVARENKSTLGLVAA